MTTKKKRLGVKLVKEFLQDEVVGIVKFNKHIFIATKHGIYCYPPDMKSEMLNGGGE